MQRATITEVVLCCTLRACAPSTTSFCDDQSSIHDNEAYARAPLYVLRLCMCVCVMLCVVLMHVCRRRILRKLTTPTFGVHTTAIPDYRCLCVVRRHSHWCRCACVARALRQSATFIGCMCDMCVCSCSTIYNATNATCMLFYVLLYSLYTFRSSVLSLSFALTSFGAHRCAFCTLVVLWLRIYVCVSVCVCVAHLFVRSFVRLVRLVRSLPHTLHRHE